MELHRIFVAAPPDAAWQAARHFDGATIPWVRLLFDLRRVPARLLGRAEAETDRRLGVDQVAENDQGFMILDEIPGREVVVGAVGRFWHMEIPFARIPPSRFVAFDEPGWGKVAWAIRVEPHGKGSVIVFELRTTATDEESWRRLNAYFHVIGAMSHLIRSSVMAQLKAQFGRAEIPGDEVRALSGDAFLPRRAIR